MGRKRKVVNSLVEATGEENLFPSSEHLEQAAFFEWIEFASKREPRLSAAFAIPNGAHLARGAITFSTLRKEGFRTGIPDVFIPIPNDGYHGLFLEFKYGKNKQTSTQAAWQEALSQLGYCVRIPYSCEEAIKQVKQYLRWGTRDISLGII